MKQLSFVSNLKIVERLIFLKSTGSVKDLAATLGMSDRMTFRYIDYIKSQGLKIEYNRNIPSYVYAKSNERLLVEFSIKKVKVKK